MKWITASVFFCPELLRLKLREFCGSATPKQKHQGVICCSEKHWCSSGCRCGVCRSVCMCLRCISHAHHVSVLPWASCSALPPNPASFLRFRFLSHQICVWGNHSCPNSLSRLFLYLNYTFNSSLYLPDCSFFSFWSFASLKPPSWSAAKTPL